MSGCPKRFVIDDEDAAPVGRFTFAVVDRRGGDSYYADVTIDPDGGVGYVEVRLRGICREVYVEGAIWHEERNKKLPTLRFAKSVLRKALRKLGRGVGSANLGNGEMQ